MLDCSQTVVGVALVALSMWNPAFLGMSAAVAQGVGAVGASMALGGIVQMLSLKQADCACARTRITSQAMPLAGRSIPAQGNPVGVLYSTREIDGAVISAGIYTEDQQ